MSKNHIMKHLHNVKEITSKDAHEAFKNPVVVITLIAIIILPSLYAVLNIEACWNPYENTKDIDFAIANVDDGATYNGESLNVGDDIVKDLRKNNDFHWVFVSESDLRRGVHNGTYYAGIVIPHNFSKSIASITTDNPKSAQLQYVINRKSNPVASKLCDSGAKAVYNDVNREIVEFINVAAYGKLGDLQSSLSSGAGQLSSGAGQLSSGASQVSSGAGQVSSGVGQVQSGASQVQSGAGKVSSGAGQVQSGASQVSSGASKVQEGSRPLSGVNTTGLPDQVKGVVDGSVKLANSSSELAGASNNLAQGSSKLAGSSVELANGASQVAGGSVSLANGALSLAAGSELLANSASGALFTAAGSLSSASSSLSDVTGVNENQIGDYFYSPVKLDKKELYPVDDYGSEVAPFYIVLSMWVGAVITAVMLKPGQATGTKYTPIEMYFGKLLIFIIMSLLQATVTLIGCFMLGIEVSNVPIFILSAYLISAVFMLICYSLISALGQVGKALSVILLVLQISGTGGIYPIEIMSQFFRTLYPYLPMTHSITLLRESALGLLWTSYTPALIYMIGLGIGTVIISAIVKQFADKGAHWFDGKLNETDLFG